DSSKLVSNPHHGTPPDRNRVTGLSAWTCQPFCCQRTFVPSLSECPDCLRTCLVGLIRPCGLAFQPCPSLTGILLRVLVALRLASQFPCGNSPLVTRHYSLPQNQ